MWLLSLILPYRMVGRHWNKPAPRATTRWWSYYWELGPTLTYRTRWGCDRLSNGKWYILHPVKPLAWTSLLGLYACYPLPYQTNTGTHPPARPLFFMFSVLHCENLALFIYINEWCTHKLKRSYLLTPEHYCKHTVYTLRCALVTHHVSVSCKRV